MQTENRERPGRDQIALVFEREDEVEPVMDRIAGRMLSNQHNIRYRVRDHRISFREMHTDIAAYVAKSLYSAIHGCHDSLMIITVTASPDYIDDSFDQYDHIDFPPDELTKLTSFLSMIVARRKIEADSEDEGNDKQTRSEVTGSLDDRGFRAKK